MTETRSALSPRYSFALALCVALCLFRVSQWSLAGSAVTDPKGLALLAPKIQRGTWLLGGSLILITLSRLLWPPRSTLQALLWGAASSAVLGLAGWFVLKDASAPALTTSTLRIAESTGLCLAGAWLLWPRGSLSGDINPSRAQSISSSTAPSGWMAWMPGLWSLLLLWVLVDHFGQRLSLSLFVLNDVGRMALHASLLIAALIEGVSRGRKRPAFPWIAGLLAILLAVRLLGSGPSALLGVTVTEGYRGPLLLVWVLAMSGLALLRWPQGGWLPTSLHGATALLVGVFVLLHYTHRFGRLQPYFDAWTLPMLGLFLPYPTWIPFWGAPVVMTGLFFLIFIGLDAFWTPGEREFSIYLLIFWAAGIGLDSSLAVLGLAVAGLSLCSLPKTETIFEA